MKRSKILKMILFLVAAAAILTAPAFAYVDQSVTAMAWVGIVIAIVIVIVLIVMIGRGSKNKPAGEAEMAGAAAVIDEAVNVINDFLNIGRDMSLLSADYNGFISYFMDPIPPFNGNKLNYAVCIIMKDAPDAQYSASRYPKMFENNPDYADRMSNFLWKLQSAVASGSRCGYQR